MSEFHISTDWPVLVLEDTEERISWFRQRLPHATFAKTAEEAFRALSLSKFKVLFLDHDLHWMHADNSTFKGTGKEVARFLAQTGFQGIVVIHSKNEDGVAAMKRYLPDARVARFGDFDIISEVAPHAKKDENGKEERRDLTMRVECYGSSLPQDGRTANEDAFLIGHGSVPFATLCDGAGNAQQAAKRVLVLFEKLFKAASQDEVSNFGTWAKWIRLLDSSLLGGPQSTFLGVAVVDGHAIGTCAGDSRAYLVNREGECRIFTERANKFRLGSGKATAFAINQPLTSGETLLLLSDGAWTPLGFYLLKKAVVGTIGRHFSEVPQAIIEAAGRTGHADDMTAVALRVLR